MDLSYLRRNINYRSYKNLKISSHKRKTKGNLSICKKYPTSHPLIPIQEILIPKDADAQEDTPLKSRMKNRSSRGFHFRFDAYRSSLRSTYLPYLEDTHNETIHDTCIQEARTSKVRVHVSQGFITRTVCSRACSCSDGSCGPRGQTIGRF